MYVLKYFYQNYKIIIIKLIESRFKLKLVRNKVAGNLPKKLYSSNKQKPAIWLIFQFPSLYPKC